MKSFRLFAILSIAAIFLNACGNKLDDMVEVEKTVSLNTTTINFSADNPVAVKVQVESNTDWMVASSGGWLQVEPRSGSGNGEITITADPNIAPEGSAAEPRTGSVVVSVGTKEEKIDVLQAEEAIVFIAKGETSAMVPALGATLEVSVETNVSYEAVPSADWIKQVSTKAVINETLTFNVDPNASYEPREANIVLTPAVGEPTTILVKQEASDKIGKITNAADFVDFLIMAPGVESNSTITLVADIDMTGIEISPATDFKGILEGDSHKIKGLNLTSGIFKKLSGTVNNLTLEATSTITPSVEVFGALADSISNATLNNVLLKGSLVCNSAEESKAGGIGGLVGIALNSNVSNCHSEASFSYTSGAETTDGSQYSYARYAGVIGYAEGSTLSNISNKGNLEVTIDGPISGANFAVAGTIAHVKNCESITEISNLGNVSGTITGTGAKWAFVGGTLCVSEGTKVINCKNTGAVVAKAQNYTNSLRTAGVISLSYADVTDCRNEGTVTSECAGSYTDCCGVVGRTSSGGNVERCVNAKNATITLRTGKLTARNSAVAGVAGFVNGTATDCENYAPVVVEATDGFGFFVGGIFGQVSKLATNCTNEGAVSVSCETMTNDMNCGGAVGNLLAGGERIINKGAITYSVVDAGSKNPNVAGVVGLGNAKGAIFKDCHNYGKVKLTSSNSVNTICVGGINGFHREDVKFESCTNEGVIEVDVKTAKANINVSGITGGNSNYGSAKDCVNRGAINVNFDSAVKLYVGGVSAVTQNLDVERATNEGNINVVCNTVGAADKLNVQIGGVSGKFYCTASQTYTATNYVNKGNINVTIGTLLGTGHIGGVTGSATTQGGTHESGNRYVLTDCTNTGTITCTTPGITIADLYTDVTTN